MARTFHMELTPSRRSKRLLNNGYYVQPPGDTQYLDMSSDDDDNSSTHSTNSSVLSERAVRYGGSDAAIHKRRWRKKRNVQSPKVSNIIAQSRQSYKTRTVEKKHTSELITSSSSSHQGLPTSEMYEQSYSETTTRRQTCEESPSIKNGGYTTAISQTQQSCDALGSGDYVVNKQVKHTETNLTHSSDQKTSMDECDVSHTKKPPDRQPEKNFATYTVPSVVANIQSYLLSWIIKCVYGASKAIYLTALTIFSYEVWPLTWRIGAVPKRVLRFFLILLILASSHFAAKRLIGDNYALTAYQALTHGWAQVERKMPEADPILSRAGGRDESISLSNQELEEALAKIEVGFAIKLAEVTDSLTELRKDLEKTDLHQQQSDKTYTQTAARITAIENKVELLRGGFDNFQTVVNKDIEKLRVVYRDTSSEFVKKKDLKVRMAALDDRLTAINDLVIQLTQKYDQRINNSTYIKQIANLQFVESFLNILEKTEAPVEDQNSLHAIFLSWLNQQGYAKREDVKSDIKVLHESFSTKLERIRQGVRRYSSTITLEKIVERPLIDTKQTVNTQDLEKDVKKWIQDALTVYSADRIALADHALETAGGSIVSTRCSESYDRKTSLISVFGIPIYYNINTPRSVIQAGSLPGECWSFKGSKGFVVIALSGSILPSSFSLEHIPRELSPLGRIDSAPKDFVVLGLEDIYDYEGTVLGEYRYEQDGPIIQQFVKESGDDKYFTYIELRVTSNWGNLEYTCLYRFRVHGQREGSEVPTS